MLTLNMVKTLAKNPAVEICLLASADELDNSRHMPSETGLNDIPVVPLPWRRSLREALWLITNRPCIDRYVPSDFWIYCSRETYVPTRCHRRIVTVHHLEPPFMGNPLSPQAIGEWRQEWRQRKALRSADLVVTQSNFTKNQVHARYGISLDKIFVVGSGVEDSLVDPAGLATINPRAAAYTPYVISTGAFHPRKGTDYLFAMARELQRRGSPLKIVCPFGIRGLPPFTDEVKLLPNVVALDYISREELLNLIRGAVCMVIPSRLEGFGLTAIESMALGTPVVASNNSALPETLGGAGILVDPNDTTSLTNAVVRLFKDQDHRTSLAVLGRRRVLVFSWTRCMERLLDSIRAWKPSKPNSTLKSA